MPSPQAPNTRTAPLTLWRSAGAFINTLFDLFGAPQDLATDHVVTTKTRALILSWLRVAEAFLRHLLVIETRTLDGGSPAASRQTQPKRRARKLRFFDADKPETWRVSFRCIASSTLRHPRIESGRDVEFAAADPVSVSLSLSKAICPAGFHSAWPLAERFEALLRVYNNPAPYARRLARRLRAAPRLIASVLRTPPEFEHRIDEETRAELIIRTAPLKPDSS
jgi:hypothetical protein